MLQPQHYDALHRMGQSEIVCVCTIFLFPHFPFHPFLFYRLSSLLSLLSSFLSIYVSSLLSLLLCGLRVYASKGSVSLMSVVDPPVHSSLPLLPQVKRGSDGGFGGER